MLTTAKRIFGEVVLKSNKHFIVNSSETNSVLALREKNLSFTSLSSIATRSFEAAKNSLEVIKFSLKTISNEQSKVAGLANKLQETVDNLSKKFGLSSYLAIILIIVFLNANLNPENSSALIGWMAFR